MAFNECVFAFAFAFVFVFVFVFVFAEVGISGRLHTGEQWLARREGGAIRLWQATQVHTHKYRNKNTETQTQIHTNINTETQRHRHTNTNTQTMACKEGGWGNTPLASAVPILCLYFVFFHSYFAFSDFYSEKSKLQSYWVFSRIQTELSYPRSFLEDYPQPCIVAWNGRVPFLPACEVVAIFQHQRKFCAAAVEKILFNIARPP